MASEQSTRLILDSRTGYLLRDNAVYELQSYTSNWNTYRPKKTFQLELTPIILYFSFEHSSWLFWRFGLRGYIWQIWHIHGNIFWKLKAYEKNRKCLFVDLSLILRKSTSQIIFDHYTNRYSIVTRWHFPNCKIYLLPDGISNWVQIFTDHVTVVCHYFRRAFIDPATEQF
jgi:hypothetical protein